MTPAGTNLLLAHAAAAPVTGVTKSLRFNGGDSPSLSRTYTSNATWTFSVWVKRSELGATNNLLGTVVQFNSSDQLVTPNLTTTAVYRDVGAWYHICVSDSGLFVNGVQVTGTVSTSALSDAKVGDSFDGYLSDVHLIDGTALDATSFAEEDSNGQWVPKAYSGSYGTEGFHLDFKEDSPTSGSNAGIGKDVSGNGNYFDTTNLAASDVVEDTPTDNYCTLNPLDKHSSIVLAEGNLKLTSGGNYYYARSTFALPSTEKWYWEYYWKDAGYIGGYGITAADFDLNDGTTGKCRIVYGGSWFGVNGKIGIDQHRNSSTYWVATSPTSNYADGDIVMVAVDRDNSKIWFGKNGDWIETSGTPNPATGANPRDSSVTSATDWFPTVGTSSESTGEVYANYGQDPTFAGNKSGGATSEFFYTPPTGFLALSTANLPTPTIAKGVTYFDTKIYDDGAGAKTFDNGTVSMQPDLVWAKSRGSSNDHKLTDSVREEQNSLESNTTDTEVAESSNVGVMSFDADGFTIGSSSSTTGPYADQTGDGMVAWAWKKSATAGFNIVGWTGDALDYGTETQELTHSLGVAPEMIILKGRTDNAGMSGGWYVYHKHLSSSSYLLLNSTDGEAPAMADVITNILPATVDVGTDDSSLYFNYGGDDFGTSADTYIGYFFASVAGYSKVGSFSGSSTAFIYTGFRPAFILAKRYDSTGGNWLMFDDKREGYNVDNDDLMANSSAVEATTDHIDILSNGFKIRTSDADLNGGTVIYLAVAKNPFKYASAR